MTGKELLIALGDINPKYYEEAEQEGLATEISHRGIHRPLLIAAIIALTALLVGCVAVFLGLQERKIGEYNSTKYVNNAGQRIDPTEITVDVISLYGYQNSPNYLATQEWYQFTAEYDPNFEQMVDTNELGIPDNYYYSYNCYTWEMVNKVDEICQKYNLKPMGEMLLVQNWDTELFFDALQISGLCHEDAQADISYGSGYFYSEGAFNLIVDFQLTGDNTSWTEIVWSTVHYSPKSCFDPKFTTIDSASYEEWNYTTADGTEVLIAMSNRGAYIFAEQADAYITVAMNTDMDWLSPADSEKHPSRSDLEQIAEVYDFTINPKPITDVVSVKERLENSMEEWNRQQEQAPQGPDYSHYAGYVDFLQNYNPWVNYRSYFAIYDIDGNGVDELLLGKTHDTFDQVMTIVDGEIVEYLITEGSHLYEGHIIDSVAPTGYSSYMRCYYDLDDHVIGGQIKWMDCLGYNFADNTWTLGEDTYTAMPISQDEAENIQSKYVLVDLELQPIMEYPVAENGKPVYEATLENTKKLTHDDIMALYGEQVLHNQENAYVPSNYYCLYDLDNNGIEELILAEEPGCFTDVYTIYNGKLLPVRYWSHMNLCEKQVVEISSSTPLSDSHTYYSYCTDGLIFIEAVRYDADGGCWYHSKGPTNDTTKIITEEEYNKIIVSHQRVEIEMKPISEYPFA